jgi:hypothetical protein
MSKKRKSTLPEMEDKSLKSINNLENKDSEDCGCRTIGGRKIIIRKPL